MAWNKLLPTGATKIKDSDDQIRANNAAIETVLGTNITAGPTTIQGAIQGDATKGRIFRGVYIFIDNGTTGVSLKCTLVSEWNGDTIAETDDIAKNATTGSFSLNAAGTVLTVEAAGLSGNVVYAIGTMYYNASTVEIVEHVRVSGNDILIGVSASTSGAAQDLTTLVDTGQIQIQILYITDA